MNATVSIETTPESLARNQWVMQVVYDNPELLRRGVDLIRESIHMFQRFPQTLVLPVELCPPGLLHDELKIGGVPVIWHESNKSGLFFEVKPA